jgi:GNAT superfamily N-acetyltransferase
MAHRSIGLRPAQPLDYKYALDLYLAAMGPTTAELMIWDEARQTASFARQWKQDDAHIIVLDDRDVGWLQAQETESVILLQQFFIEPDCQGQGIGSQVLARLLDGWQTVRKPVVLAVLKNNPARRLYERFGFVVVDEVGVKFLMRRET